MANNKTLENKSSSNLLDDFNKLINFVFTNKLIFWSLLILIVLALSYVSFGKTFEYTFWRDQTLVIWKSKFVPQEIYNLTSSSAARGRIGAMLIDYFLFVLLGTSAARWQLAGFLLKIVNTFLLYFFAKYLFNSKRIAITSAVLTASFIGGLEAYSWVYGIGFMISFILAGGALYLRSYYQKSKLSFLIANILIALALTIDVWRALSIIFLLSFWEVLMILSKDRFRSKSESIKRITVFVGFQFISLKLIQALVFALNPSNAFSSSSSYLKNALTGVGLENFFYTIGNLVRIPFFPIREEGGLTSGDNIGLIIGVSFVAVLFVLGLQFLRKRKTSVAVWILLFAWVPFFYGISWMYDKNLVLGYTHRYIAFSAIVIPLIWAKLITSLKSLKVAITIFVLIVSGNMLHAQKVTMQDYQIRGAGIVDPVWQTISQTVPIGENSSMFHATGGDYRIGYIFQWGGTFPFGTLRNIRREDLLPIFVNEEIAEEKICSEENNNRPATEAYSIDKVYSWYMPGDGVMINQTNDYRLELTNHVSCLWKNQDINFGSILLQSTAFIDLYSSDSAIQRKAFLIQTSSLDKNYQYIANLINLENGEILDSDVAALENHVEFTFDNYIEVEKFGVEMSVCNNSCIEAKNIIDAHLIEL